MQLRILALRVMSCFLLVSFLSCKSKNTNNKPAIDKVYTSPCGCLLSKNEMITKCPIDAVGDSVVICKVGTNNVIGSNRPPMTWPEFIASEYFGGEGQLINCKTGQPLNPDARSPIISYKNKKLLVDKRLRLDVYDPTKKEWIDMELPVWRNTISAVNSELVISGDSLLFKLPFHGKDAFASVAKEYEDEVKRTDHYMITRTVNRLLICAISGDKLSQERLLNLQHDFSDYYSGHADSQELLNESLKLYQAYKDAIDRGAKPEFYELSKLVTFKPR